MSRILPTKVKALVKRILLWERLIKIFQATWLKAEIRIRKKTKLDNLFFYYPNVSNLEMIL
jgi:hypothetical protein